MLGLDHALARRFAPPLDGQIPILGDAPTVVVEGAEIVLGARIASLRKGLPDVDRRRVVAGLIGLPTRIEFL